jgi:DNA-binding XRE family transcriptional regulator
MEQELVQSLGELGKRLSSQEGSPGSSTKGKALPWIPKPPKIARNADLDIGKAFRDLRVSLFLSQSRAAWLAGVAPSTVNKIEQGSRAIGMLAFSRLVVSYRNFVRATYPQREKQYDLWLSDILEMIADKYTSFDQ